MTYTTRGKTMNINDLTIGDAKELAAMFGNTVTKTTINSGMIGKYVVVRCRDAGVHAGVLESHSGRECVLTESRRLWYWKAAKGAFLSSVAVGGITKASKVGERVERIHLTENCEIIQCSGSAEKTIRDQANHNE